jgi:CheY-like chemotaxis protein
MHKSILVVEDDQDIRDSLQDVLDLMGFRVTVASNGQEALEQLSKMEPPCLILLDLMMPVMNGWEFRSCQKENPKFAEIPVVVVSADGNVKQKAESLGVAHCLKKPVDIDTLMKVAQTFCTQPARPNQPN